MQKWKHDYHLSKLKNRLRNDESGITLVEFLAAIALLSVIILLGGSIHMFGQRQFQAQTESASQNNDLSYAMTVMSTDLRKQNPEDVDVRENEIFINDDKIYYVSNHNLYDEQTILAESVDEMQASKENNEIRVEITTKDSTPGVMDKKYQTTIHFRGELKNEETAERNKKK